MTNFVINLEECFNKEALDYEINQLMAIKSTVNHLAIEDEYGVTTPELFRYCLTRLHAGIVNTSTSSPSLPSFAELKTIECNCKVEMPVHEATLLVEIIQHLVHTTSQFELFELHEAQFTTESFQRITMSYNYKPKHLEQRQRQVLTVPSQIDKEPIDTTDTTASVNTLTTAALANVNAQTAKTDAEKREKNNNGNGASIATAATVSPPNSLSSQASSSSSSSSSSLSPPPPVPAIAAAAASPSSNRVARIEFGSCEWHSGKHETTISGTIDTNGHSKTGLIMYVHHVCIGLTKLKEIIQEYQFFASQVQMEFRTIGFGKVFISLVALDYLQQLLKTVPRLSSSPVQSNNTGDDQDSDNGVSSAVANGRPQAQVTTIVPRDDNDNDSNDINSNNNDDDNDDSFVPSSLLVDREIISLDMIRKGPVQIRYNQCIFFKDKPHIDFPSSTTTIATDTTNTNITSNEISGSSEDDEENNISDGGGSSTGNANCNNNSIIIQNNDRHVANNNEALVHDYGNPIAEQNHDNMDYDEEVDDDDMNSLSDGLSLGEGEDEDEDHFANDDEDDESNNFIDGSFSLSDTDCEFYGFHIGVGQEQADSTLLLQLCLKHAVQQLHNSESAFDDLHFRDCTIAVEALPHLLNPIVLKAKTSSSTTTTTTTADQHQSSWSPSSNDFYLTQFMTFDCCRFYSNALQNNSRNTITKPFLIPELFWKQEYSSLLVKISSIKERESIHLISKIVQACPAYHNLSTFDMSQNCVGDDALLGYSQCPNLSQIEYLYLGGNRITDKGANYLLQVLQNNTKMTSLLICKGTSITNTGMKGLLNILLHDNMTLHDVRFLDEAKYDRHVMAKIHFLAQLNKAGRRHLLTGNISPILMAQVLGKKLLNPSIMYWMLQEFPHELMTGHTMRKVTSLSRKRKHDVVSAN